MEGRKKFLTEGELRRNLIDCRSMRPLQSIDPHDIRTERDSFISVRREIMDRILRRTKFWGIILPGDIGLIDIQNINKIYPNCMNGIYTNIWTVNPPDPEGKIWQDLFILSPNYGYLAPYGKYIDLT